MIKANKMCRIAKGKQFLTLCSENSFATVGHTYWALAKPEFSSVTNFVHSHSRF